MALERIKKSFSVKLIVFVTLFFAMGHTAFAGTLRKPPNNLGLVAYWPFDENGGMTAGDASGNGHTGTLVGTAALPTWVSGKLGRALSFPSAASSDTKVTFAPISVGATHTISMWIYLTANCTTGYSNLFAQDGVNGLYCLRTGGVNKLDYYGGGAPLDHFNNTALVLNRWYHVAVTSDGVITTTFYLNGVADGGISGSTITYAANEMGSDSLFESFAGSIDEVRVYNRTLPASEVLALYKSGEVQVNNSYKSPGTLSSGLTAYYTFDGKDMIQNVADISGNNRNGILTGYTTTGTTTVPGKVGQALTFNGSTNYVSTSAVGNFFSAATSTISVWLRPTGNAITIGSAASIYTGQNAISCSCIASFGITRANRTDLVQDRIWIWLYSSPQIGIPYSVGEWAHITLVHANGVLYAYKNGDLVGSATAGNFPNFSGTFFVGYGWTAGANRWRGDIDEVRTYNRGLSAAEIKQLYNLTLGTKVNKPAVNSLTNGLVGYWTFDGGDTDWSTNTMVNRGSVGGTATFGNLSTTTSPVPGKVGQGLTFDGTSTYVDLGNVASFKPTGNFSTSFWYKGLKGSTETFLSGSPQVLSNFWYIDNSQVLFCGGTTCATSTAKAHTLPNDNEWHHLVAVLNRTPNPDTLTVYIDGVSQGTVTGTADGGSSYGSSARIGAPTWNNVGYRQGPMDEVRIYNRALSAAEALQLYRMGK